MNKLIKVYFDTHDRIQETVKVIVVQSDATKFKTFL